MMFADRLRVSKIVMLVQQAVEQPFVRRASHLPELQRPQITQARAKGCAI